MSDSLLNILNIFIQTDNLNITFVGPSGSGKTTIIYSIIREYYHHHRENIYNKNILYITSLNGLGIEYFRNEVKTFCQIKSAIPHKKKIVVLDDLDMINEQNQQVIRNIIDKYSNNVHFLASCSNIHKIIDNLQSRFTLLTLDSFKREDLRSIMNTIIHREDMNIQHDAKDLLLDICNNNIKILINYLEKMKLINKEITLDLTIQLCTTISFNVMQQYTQFIKNQQLVEAIHTIREIHDKGYSVVDILDNYFHFVKTTNYLTDVEKYNIIPYICKYIAVFNEIHEDDIELSLFTNNLIIKLSIV